MRAALPLGGHHQVITVSTRRPCFPGWRVNTLTQNLCQHFTGAEGEADAGGEGGEAAALAALMARERCLRDRNSQLLAPGKSFRRVLDVLAAVQVPPARDLYIGF